MYSKQCLAFFAIGWDFFLKATFCLIKATLWIYKGNFFVFRETKKIGLVMTNNFLHLYLAEEGEKEYCEICQAICVQKGITMKDCNKDLRNCQCDIKPGKSKSFAFCLYRDCTLLTYVKVSSDLLGLVILKKVLHTLKVLCKKQMFSMYHYKYC